MTAIIQISPAQCELQSFLNSQVSKATATAYRSALEELFGTQIIIAEQILEVTTEDGETQGYQPTNAGSKDGDRPTPHYHNFWADPDYIYCRDGYYRPIRSGGGAESATFCLLNGYPGRSASLRLLGNGIVVPQAQAFIESHIEAKIEMEKMNDSNNTD